MKYLLLIKETREVRDCSKITLSYFAAIQERTSLPRLRAESMLKSGGRIKTEDAEFWIEEDAPHKGGRPPMVLPGGRFSPHRPASEEAKRKQSESMKRVMASRAAPIGKKRKLKRTWLPCAQCGDLDGRLTRPHQTQPDRFHGERFGVEGMLCNACYQRAYRKAKRDGTYIAVKYSWKPCARCGEPDGPLHPSGTHPQRYSAERFQIAGEICRNCYEVLRRHQKAGTEPEAVAKTWAPCAECGDPDGKTSHHNTTPDRYRGERWGIKGLICDVCYQRHYRRDKRAAPATASVSTPVVSAKKVTKSKTWAPCVNCGNPDGAATGKNTKPSRYNGERFGVNGKICHNCYARLWAKQKKEAK